MNRATHREVSFIAAAYAAPALPAIILVLAALIVIRRGFVDATILDLSAQSIDSLIRASAAGASAAVLVGVLGVGMASFAIRAWLHPSRAFILIICISLSLAVTPLLLGASSFAFLWRSPYAEWLTSLPYISSRGSSTVVIIDVIAQVIRYAPLATWLMTIVVLQTDATFRFYSQHVGVSPLSLVRTEFSRHWIVPTLVVAAFAYQDAFNDYIITYLVLKPSVATNTELVSHFLNRVYVSLAISRSATQASAGLLGVSLVSTALSMLVFGGVATLILYLFKMLRMPFSDAGRVSAPALRADRTRVDKKYASVAWIPISAGALVSFALFVKLLLIQKANIAAIAPLGFTLAVSLAVSLTCWWFAILVTFMIRESKNKSNGSAQKTFAKVALIAISLGFVPPLGLSAAIYTILFFITDLGQTSAAIGWFIAQTLRMFPLIIVLLIPTCLAVEDSPIWYLQMNGATFFKRLTMIVLTPFRVTHFAILLIGWNFVFNESIVASVFQADIPAFSDIVQRASSGRSAAYPIAGLLVTVEATLFGILCLLWGFQVYRSWFAKHATD